MAREVRTLSEPDLELALLRKGVGARLAGRDRCADCGRSPLVGERMFRFGVLDVCALCRAHHREEPEAEALVRHFERGHTVRLVPRAA